MHVRMRVTSSLGPSAAAAAADGQSHTALRVLWRGVQGYFTKASKWVPWHEEHDALRAYQHRLDHNEVACELECQ